MNDYATIGVYIFTMIIVFAVTFVCMIVNTINLSKIKDVQCKPFQNKKPDYPDKVIELLQTIVSMQQHQTEEIEKVKQQLEIKNNGGTKPGMKPKETVNHEEMVRIHKEQTELLQKILEATNGEEKKKMQEKWRQAVDIINNS